MSDSTALSSPNRGMTGRLVSLATRSLVSLLLGLLIAAPSLAVESIPLVKSRHFDDFSLPRVVVDPSQAKAPNVSLSADSSAEFHVVCFLGTECPLAKVYGPRLQRLSQQYLERGVSFVGINSNVQDSMDDLVAYVERHGIQFPMAKDYDRAVAVQVGATRTPEVFLVDRSGAIRYQGRIDNQYEPGLSRSSASEHHLQDAIEELLASKPVSKPHVPAVGCLIALPKKSVTKNSSVTYCRQVARVLQEHCIECHRQGEIGPFALDQYDEVIGWADMSLEVIDQGRMPPWHASPKHGSFANARHMPESDKQLLRDWVDAGMPYGDSNDLPPQQEYVQGWRFGKEPDLVLNMSDQPFLVPAEGTVEYQYFVVDPGFTEDKWIRSAQVIPGDSAVVHHTIVFSRPPDDGDFRDAGLLSAYVPGQVRSELPAGYAQRVAAGSRLVFQMHYTPNGKVTEDKTRLGLVFADPKEVTHEIIALGGVEQEFEIPPGAANHEVNGRIGWFPTEGMLLSIMPHMHLRGKSFEFYVESKTGEEQVLDVPLYDFNWQHNYEFSQPMPLKDIKELKFSAIFDNSDANPNNPDPSEYVTWGDQTWQEMAVTFISVARPLNPPKQETSETTQAKQQRKQREAQWRKEANEFAKEYIQRFDGNGDQHLASHELPVSVRLYSFRAFDHDNDSLISREEIADERFRRLRRSR